MNLDDVLRDPSRSGSLTDHDWWIDGLVKDGELTYDPSDNYRDNNKKDDLEIQWGNGTIEPTYSNEEEIPVPSGFVDRNIPPEALGDANPVIMFARDLMNRGVMGSDLQRRIRERFEQNAIKTAATGLRDLFEMDGIIGRIAVDTRGYGSAKEAVDATANNPYKHFIKYVVTAPRASEDYLWLPNKNEQRLATDVVSSGNAIDDFFGGEDSPNKSLTYKSDLVAYCKETMLPVLAGQGDLDSSEMDDTLTELLNVSGLPSVDLDNIMNNDKYATNLAKVQAAFRCLNRRREAAEVKKYAGSVDASEFVIQTREQEIEIQAAYRIEPLDIDPVNHCLQNQISIEPARRAESSLDVSIFGEMTDVILANEKKAGLFDVRQAEAFNSDIDIDPRREAQAPMRVQEREIDGMSVLDEAMRFTSAQTPEITGLHHSLTVPVDNAPKRHGSFDLFEESNGQMDGLIAFDDDIFRVGELGAPMEIEMDESRMMDAAIEVDMMGNNMEFSLTDEIIAQDVSLAQHEDPMFVGGDFDFDDKPKRQAEVDVELGSSMEW